MRTLSRLAVAVLVLALPAQAFALAMETFAISTCSGSRTGPTACSKLSTSRAGSTPTGSTATKTFFCRQLRGFNEAIRK